MLDDGLKKKLRIIQGKLIHDSKTSVTFSKVINDVLREGMKNGRAKQVPKS